MYAEKNKNGPKEIHQLSTHYHAMKENRIIDFFACIHKINMNYFSTWDLEYF